jgi:hypothetical protein
MSGRQLLFGSFNLDEKADMLASPTDCRSDKLEISQEKLYRGQIDLKLMYRATNHTGPGVQKVFWINGI